MFFRSKSLFYISICMLMVLPAIGVRADLRARIKEATSGFKDATVTCKVLSTNRNELQKIGKDFSKSYEFKNTTVWYKAPDKMKVEGNLGMVKVCMIMSDKYKCISVPSLHLSKREDISDDPHKRQTDFDMGIITESLWLDYIVTDTEIEKSGDKEIAKITFIRDNSREKKLVAWVDVDSLKLLKVDKYESNGALKSRLIFSGHVKYGSIWVPGRVDVYSPSGKLAASSGYEGIKVNTGLSDSMFKM